MKKRAITYLRVKNWALKEYCKINIIFLGTIFSFLAVCGKSGTNDSLIIKQVQKICDTSGNLGNILGPECGFAIRIACIGDLDGDGVPDMAASAMNESKEGFWHGSFYILFLNNDGTVKRAHQISEKHAGLDTSFPENYRFGTAICSIGDIDGDGVQDLAVTAMGANSYQGALWILKMKRNGNVKSHLTFDRYTPGFPVLRENDLFGNSIANIGDLDGDGVNDLVVGAPGDAGKGVERGAVYVIFLNKGGLFKSYSRINENSGNFKGTLHDLDMFGMGVASAGDVDGDGIPDILVGAQGASDKTGAAWFLFMNRNGLVKKQVLIDNSQASIAGGIAPASYFGTDVALLPDIDGDGVHEILVGAEGDNTGGKDCGAVYILYPAANGEIKHYQKICNSAQSLNYVLGVNGQFGPGLAYIPGFNNKYQFTIGVGAFKDNAGAYKAGALYIISLNSLKREAAAQVRKDKKK